MSYDYELDRGGVSLGPGAAPPGPAWLRSLWGDDFVANVCLVSVWDAGVIDASMSNCVSDANLARLVDDDGLAVIEELTRLQWLYLGGTPIRDADLKHFEGLTQLHGLNLSRTKVTDAGLRHLQGLTRLRRSYLSHTKVTDVGLKELEGFTRLEDLNLAVTLIADQGLEHLEGLTQLRDLDPPYMNNPGSSGSTATAQIRCQPAESDSQSSSTGLASRPQQQVV